MHDHPGIWPPLPSREMTEADQRMAETNRGTPFESCWEFRLSHDMTDAEGSAFWHGANLVYDAMKRAEEARDANA